jgi:hypothetical protein
VNLVNFGFSSIRTQVTTPQDNAMPICPQDQFSEPESIKTKVRNMNDRSGTVVPPVVAHKRAEADP